MNELIIICAKYLIFISAAYAFFHVVIKHERKNHIRHVVTIFGSAVFAWVIAHVLKNAVAHPRPDALHALIVPDDVYSFPSGHATFMFALAFCMYGFDKRAGKVLFVFAVITSVARVFAGVHFWYDIIGGMVLGAGVASIVYFLTKATKKYIKQ